MKRGPISQGDFNPNPNTRQRREANEPVPSEAPVMGTHERQGSEATGNADLPPLPITPPLPFATEPDLVALASVGGGDGTAPAVQASFGEPIPDPAQLDGQDAAPEPQGEEREDYEAWYMNNAGAEQQMLARFQRAGPSQISAHLLNDYRQHEAVFNKLAQDSTVTELTCTTVWELQHDYPGEALYAAIRKNGLRTLILTGLRLDDAGWASLGEALAANNSLESLRLDLGRVSAKQLRHLVDGLIANRSIRHFHLESSETGPGCSVELSRLLKENGTVRKLALSCDSQVEVEDFLAMMDGLSVNRTLCELSIFPPDSTLNLSDVARVIRALSGPPQLREVSFWKLRLDLEAARSLAEFIAASPVFLVPDDLCIPGPAESHGEREQVGLQLYRTSNCNKRRLALEAACAARPDLDFGPLNLDEIRQLSLPPSFELPDEL